MHDKDVRQALHDRLHSDPTFCDDRLVVDELGLCGKVRVDVAVVDDALSGFELKSATDTLQRLPTQVEVYSQVLDAATLVVAENHLDLALELLPEWWGCVIATEDDNVTRLEHLRSPSRTPR